MAFNSNLIFFYILAEARKFKLLHSTHYTLYVIVEFWLVFELFFYLFSYLLFNVKSIVLRNEVYQGDLMQTFAVLHNTLLHKGI